MNLFDEGRLTDRFGRVTNFRSAVIVMTSNLGASNSPSVGFSASRSTRYVEEALAFFRPEFFNRIDDVVSFSPLDRDTILSITRKELKDVADREGLRSCGLRLTWTEAVVEHLAAAGFDPIYGARPLQRIIEEQLVVPLAKWMLQSPVRAEGEIKITVSNQELRLERV
jgi:ATP-dependent Clp protease ATP-binding subunit ClpC